MNKLQFDIDEDPLYSPISPDVVDISSGSEGEFSIAPGDVTQLNDRFRIDTTGSNLMSAFVGAATATLYPDTEMSPRQDTTTIASGTQLERELMDLIEVPQNGLMESPGSFVDSEFEEGNLFPWTMGVGPERTTNNYGRPTARVLPTPRTNSSDSGILPRPIPIYPPNYRQEQTGFQQRTTREPMEQEVRNNTIPQQRLSQDNITGFNLSPMLFPLNIGGTNHGIQHMAQLIQPTVQLGFPFNMTHSANSLLIPAQERHSIRLIPTVMPNVAGYCEFCGKCYDQIALETLGEYLVATEYEGETVKERTIRSRAFIHGFEAALFLFKNAGLSHSSRCDGSVVQQ